MKTFTLYLDNSHRLVDNVYETYGGTQRAIEANKDEINTTSLASLGFYLIELGYKIFIVRNGISKEFYPGMDSKSTDKEIRKEHNIMKLIQAHIFDRDFE